MASILINFLTWSYNFFFHLFLLDYPQQIMLNPPSHYSFQRYEQQNFTLDIFEIDKSLEKKYIGTLRRVISYDASE